MGQQKLTLSRQEQLEDFKALADSLKFVHPNLYASVSEKEFQNTIDSLEHTMLEEISLGGFYHKSMSLLQKIADGHVQLNYFSLNQARDYSSPIYYFRYYLKDNRIYIVDSNEEDKHFIGYELQSINGIPIQKIIHHIRTGSICYDGGAIGFQTYQLNDFFLLPYFMVQYFDLQSTAHFTLKKGEDVVEILLSKDNKRKMTWFPSQRSSIIHTEFNEVGSHLFLNSMGLNSFQSTTELKRYFEKIRLDTLSSFVLDLRNNTGGLNHIGQEILTYFISDTTYYLEKGIMNKSYLEMLKISNVDRKNEMIKVGADMMLKIVPAKGSFKGRLYVLLNNGTFSNGVYLASHLKRQKNVVLVGDTAGGSGYRSNAGIMYQFILPNSKLQVTTGLFYNQIYGSLQSDTLLSPTIRIEYNMADIILKKDKEMSWVIALMKKTNNFVY